MIYSFDIEGHTIATPDDHELSGGDAMKEEHKN